MISLSNLLICFDFLTIVPQSQIKATKNTCILLEIENLTLLNNQ